MSIMKFGECFDALKKKTKYYFNNYSFSNFEEL